ncbi:hypothetical protein CPAR01_14033 [Colletotrichum paranaense]|uniref:Uncharacterized protein n=1 Tax=Colletotrichum paranaense TaxID=1914294 RepID=A0ABQ9S300_9PEZI|nr:uncharacterized protein CPAR01_14033 [Colletotrichum paranaense]KAK1523180.1 hypothetical protein CPAR01_14033 [Colletotrichum paranaense]
MDGRIMDGHPPVSSTKEQDQGKKVRQGPTTQQQLQRQQERSKETDAAGVGAGDGRMDH